MTQSNHLFWRDSDRLEACKVLESYGIDPNTVSADGLDESGYDSITPYKGSEGTTSRRFPYRYSWHSPEIWPKLQAIIERGANGE